MPAEIGTDTFLKSTYGAWGYISEGHLGTTSTSNGTVVGRMNDRLALACSNARAAGIIVHAVAFQVTDPDTLTLLENCATQSDMAFQSSTTSALLAAFTADRRRHLLVTTSPRCACRGSPCWRLLLPLPSDVGQPIRRRGGSVMSDFR